MINLYVEISQHKLSTTSLFELALRRVNTSSTLLLGPEHNTVYQKQFDSYRLSFKFQCSLWRLRETSSIVCLHLPTACSSRSSLPVPACYMLYCSPELGSSSLILSCHNTHVGTQNEKDTRFRTFETLFLRINWWLVAVLRSLKLLDNKSHLLTKRNNSSSRRELY